MKQKGFTLLELLIVIGIMSIMAGVMIVGFRGASQRARIAQGWQFSDSLRASLQPYMVAWWSFNETAGVVAKDNYFNQYHSDVNGASWTEGISNGALSFDGNDYVVAEADVPENDFTIEMWVKTACTSCGIFHIVGSGTPCVGGHDRHFYLSSGRLCFRVWQGAAWCVTEPLVNDDVWHHLVLTVKTGLGQRAYIDSKLVGTNTYDHSDFDWQTHVVIGHSCDAATDYFTGLIDEVRIYDQALPETVIRSNFKKRLVFQQ